VAALDERRDVGRTEGVDVELVTFESFNERDRPLLDAAAAELAVTVTRRDGPTGDEQVLLVEQRTLEADDLIRMPRLQTIVLMEHGRALLPVNHIAAKGIALERIPDLSGLGVAEHTFALLLALKKQLIPSHQAVRENRWSAEVTAPLYTDQRAHVFNWSGIENLGWIWGETIGIVGFGRIGKAVAARAQAFGMHVVYYNRHRLPAAMERQLGVRYAPLDELVAIADVVTLHLPFSPESEHLIGVEQFARMKPTALLINVARGRVVDEQAIITALREGTIAGAGLDVLVYEPPHPDNPILQLNNVVFSPHTAGVYSPTARREQFRAAVRAAVTTTS
jgi:phosphoglycerate dehydrogenase-like enzyme